MRAPPRLRLILSTIVVLLAGCDDGLPPDANLSIQKAPTDNGDNQTDTVLATLASPLRVLVLRGGSPEAGVTVDWTVRADTSLVSTPRTSTDGSGIASLTLTFGQTPRRYTVVAQLFPGTGRRPVVFTATANPGRPAVLRIVSGDNQADSTKARLSADYTVQVQDGHTNNLGGVVIDWAVTAGEGSITPAQNTTQSASGNAAARHTLGPNDGAQTVTATASGITNAPHVTFTATAYTMGNLNVTATTTGVDLDPNGYNVTAQGPFFLKQATVAVNGTTTMRIRPGDYAVILGQVAVNCDISPPSSKNVTLPSGGTVAAAFDVACAAATTLAYAGAVGGTYEIFVIRSNGTSTTRLTTNTAGDVEPAWSRDGAKIAFQSTRDNNPEIYVMEANGSNQVRLTNNVAADRQPAWSPDGTRIAFVSERDGNTEIYVMNADGTNPLRVTNNPAFDSDPAWSPDGTKIAFTRSGNVSVMNPDGTGSTALTTDGTDGEPSWSPDGTKIAFTRSDYSYSCYYYCSAVFTMNVNGSGAVSLTSGPYDTGPTWSPDGRWIAFAFCDDYYCSQSGIRAVSLDGTRVEPVTTGTAYSPAWRP